MILSKVDFPQPEGPMILTNSPFFTSKVISVKVCVDPLSE